MLAVYVRICTTALSARTSTLTSVGAPGIHKLVHVDQLDRLDGGHSGDLSFALQKFNKGRPEHFVEGSFPIQPIPSVERDQAILVVLWF